MKKILALIFIILLQNQVGLAQSDPFAKEFIAIHPKIGVAYTNHLPDFETFQGMISCGEFTQGSGLGMDGFIFLEKSIFEKAFIGFGIGFIDRRGDLGKANYDTNFARNVFTGEIENVKTENVLEVELSYLEIQPEFRYILFDNIINGPLRLMIAPRIAFPMSKHFRQEERIVEPDYASFNTGDGYYQQRLLAEQDIITINNINYGFSAGIENLLKISKKHYLSQQVVFDYNFNDIVTDASWKFWAVRFEIGLRLQIAEREEELIAIKEEPVVTPEPMPAIEPEPVPIPSIKLTLVDESAKLFTGNELISTQPIVNAVFFDKEEINLPAEYITEVNEDISWFYGDPVEIHYHILPRMKEIIDKNPTSTLEIKAYTSGDETGGMELARARAESVKEAMLSLGVPSGKVKTIAILRPEYPSNEEFEEGSAENRRVDIILKNAHLQEYVSVQKYTEIKGEIEVDLDVENLEENNPVIISSNLLDEDIEKYSDERMKIWIDERIPMELKYLDYNINAYYEAISDKLLDNIDISALEKEVVELNLDNFIAVLTFPYNSSQLSKENKELLNQLAELLPEGETIVISGSADRLGSEERNIILEEERAINTIDYIKNTSNKNIIIEKGDNKFKVNENTPQGRFINRSISLRIK